MKRSSSILFLSIALAACVDTTGLSPESSRPPHPGSTPNAVVVVAEFADFQCPACKAAHTQILKPLIEQYGSQIRYEFHHFPLVSLHQFAMPAAEASECAADQGKFWEFVDTNYTRQEELSNDALDTWGRELGLDADLYARCRKSHIKRDLILASYDLGRSMEVTGTPTFFVNGKRVESTLSAIITAIGEATNAAGQML